MTEAGVEVVRGYVIERMRLVGPADLYKAIKDHTHTLSVAESKDKSFGQKWSKVIEKYTYDGKKLRREMMTPENVLEWLRVDRPDLASLIINMHEEGKEWLKADVDELFKFLFPVPQAPPAIKLAKPTIPASAPAALTFQPESSQKEDATADQNELTE